MPFRIGVRRCASAVASVVAGLLPLHAASANDIDGVQPAAVIRSKEVSDFARLIGCEFTQGHRYAPGQQDRTQQGRLELGVSALDRGAEFPAGRGRQKSQNGSCMIRRRNVVSPPTRGHEGPRRTPLRGAVWDHRGTWLDIRSGASPATARRRRAAG